MAQKIDELFPIPTYPGTDNTIIGKILSISYIYAVSNRHRIYTIEHIVYGYMKFIEENTLKGIKPDFRIFPWYTNPLEYLKCSDIVSIEKIGKIPTSIKIDSDVLRLSKEYKKFLSAMTIETFYYLICYMNKQMFLSRYYVPCRAPELEFVLNSCTFDKFLKTEYSYYFSRILYSKKKKSSNEQDAWNSLNDGLKNYSNFKTNDSIDVPIDISKKPPIDNTVIYRKPFKLEMTTDITTLACNGFFPKIVGRDYEVQRLIDILSKYNKHNAILIGEPGVGKTAIVQALAQKIVKGNIPNFLKNFRILELDVTSTIAGAVYRGEFEKRVKRLLDSLENSSESLILYIDEIHTTTGLGDTADGGTLSFTDMLKPLMLKQNIRVIGTSTFKDYRLIESDKSLERRFDTITVNEPSFNDSVQILKTTKKRLEQYYNLKISTKTIKSVISLSKQYLPESRLPAKAIDIMDEACAIRCNSEDLQTDKEPNSDAKNLTEEDIKLCISRKKNIPIGKIQTTFDLSSLEKSLEANVIGQDHVAKIISQAICRSKAGFNDENRPLASFLFIGPTGVGKTEIAKTLADIVFSGRNNLIRFDMSEYVEESSISKLIGSPPGYIGYEDAGLLTEKVKHHPYSLVLFDEIEKAHNKIYNLLLQIFDEGWLTDSHGEKINFKNAIIILTSNTGVSEAVRKNVGFIEDNTSKSKNMLSAVKKEFPPEFINRLDEIIQFNSLTKNDLLKIANICINKDIITKLSQKSIIINISDDVISYVVEKGYKPEYGARELKRTINREIITPLSEYILNHDEISSINLTIENNELKISSNLSVCV